MLKKTALSVSSLSKSVSSGWNFSLDFTPYLLDNVPDGYKKAVLHFNNGCFWGLSFGDPGI